jgi:hypothetical protein
VQSVQARSWTEMMNYASTEAGAQEVADAVQAVWDGIK